VPEVSRAQSSLGAKVVPIVQQKGCESYWSWVQSHLDLNLE